MNNSLLLLGFLCLSVLGVNAQSFVDIGEGTVGTGNPIFTSWKYGWSTFLYTSEELGGAKTIDKVSYHAALNTFGAEHNFENQIIYFQLTSSGSVSTMFPDVSTGGYTKVYEGTLKYPTNSPGWIILDIDNFEYDGTSNLVIHYQNHSGYSPSVPSMFSGTKVESGMGAVKGDDSVFPTNTMGWSSLDRPNIRIFTPLDEAKPGTPVLVSPLEGSTQVLSEDVIEFSIINSDKYDVYFGTDESSLEKVISDALVTEDGTYSYSPENPLESKTQYYIKVIAYKGDVTAESPVFSFTSQKIINTLPYECGFEEHYVHDFGTYTSKVNSVINTAFPVKSDWTYNNEWRCYEGSYQYGGNWVANVTSGIIGDYVLTTPRFSFTEDCFISFYWKNGVINKESVTTYLEVSVDGGVNWQELAALKPENRMSSYKFEKIYLEGISGNNTYFRWRHHQHQASTYNNFYLDDIKIDVAVSGPEIMLDADELLFNEISVNGEVTKTFTIKNVGNEDLTITGNRSVGMFSCDFTGSILAGTEKELEVKFNPEFEGDFDMDLIFDCNTANGSFSVKTKGTAYQRMTEFSEEFTAGGVLPERWSALNSAKDVVSLAEVTSFFWNVVAHSGRYAASITRGSDMESPLMLISPGVKGYDKNELTFYAMKPIGAEYDLSVDVGVMTNLSDPNSFKLVKNINLTSEYQQFNVVFSEGETYPYIAFRHNDMEVGTKIFIDDVTWAERISTSVSRDNSKANGLAIFPNPTNGILNIFIPDTNPKIVKVYNQLGSVVYSTKTSDTSKVLDLNFLPIGWYSLVVTSEGVSYKKAFIKK